MRARRRATCRRSCRCSPSTARLGSRSAPTTASRSTSRTTATSTRWCATPSRSVSHPRTRSTAATLSPSLWHGLAHLGAVAPGYHADLLVLPDLERFVPETVLKRGSPAAEIPEAEVPDWVRHTVRIGAFGPEMFRIPWEGGDARVIGIVPGQILTDSLVDAPAHRAGEALRRSRARPRQDRGRRAAPGHGPRRARLRARVRPAARRARIVGRARRAQRRRRRDERRVDGGRRAPACKPRRRHRRRRRRRGARRAAAAGRGPALGRTARRGARGLARGDRRSARAGLRARGAVPASRVPRAVGDPVPEADRPRARRRRPLRARAAGGRSDPRQRLGADLRRRGHRARARLDPDRGRAGRRDRRRRRARGRRGSRRRGRHAGPRQHAPPPLPDADARPGAAGRPLHLAEDALPDLGAHRRPDAVRRCASGDRRARAVRAARPSSTTTTSSRAASPAWSRPRSARRRSSAFASSRRAARWTSASRTAACLPTRSSRSIDDDPRRHRAPRRHSRTATGCGSPSRPARRSRSRHA